MNDDDDDDDDDDDGNNTNYGVSYPLHNNAVANHSFGNMACLFNDDVVPNVNTSEDNSRANLAPSTDNALIQHGLIADNSSRSYNKAVTFGNTRLREQFMGLE